MMASYSRDNKIGINVYTHNYIQKLMKLGGQGLIVTRNTRFPDL